MDLKSYDTRRYSHFDRELGLYRSGSSTGLMAQNHNLTAHLTPIMYIDDDNDADIGQSWRKTGRECPYPVVVKTRSKYE